MSAPASDILRGARAIADHLKLPVGVTYRLLETDALPAHQPGGSGCQYIASRRALDAFFGRKK